MKRMLLLLPILFLLAGCGNDLPPDYVKENQIVIDNETPFVYVELDSLPFKHTIGEIIRVSEYEMLVAETSDKPWTYISSIKYCGNKVIRHMQDGGKDIYYTVYAWNNYSLWYLFLVPDEEGVLYIDESTICDARDTVPGILAQDQPTVILNGRLPDGCYKEDYTFDEIAAKVEGKWRLYSQHCAIAGLEHPFLYTYSRKYNIQSFIRCMQVVRFDEGENTYRDGLYAYDLFVHDDGTGTLHFRHMYLTKYPTYDPPEQDENITLTKEETDHLLAVFEEYDFPNIPTWNPEEGDYMDGEWTYVFRDGHLISMHCATERYGIYHIREAFEETVRQHITVSSGRIYR